MEILNNIWSALSTENEVFVKLIMIPSALIEAYFSLLMFCTILKIEYTRFQKYIYIFGMSSISTISLNFIPSPANTLVNYIVLFFIIYKLFKLSIIKTMISIIIPFVMFSIVGTLLLNPLLKVFNIELSVLNYIPIYRIVYLTILYFILFIFIYILKIKNKKVSLLNNIPSHTKNILLFNLSLGIFTLAVQVIITVFYINILPVYITFLSSISLILYVLISFYSFNHIIKLQKATLDLENAENYNKTLSFLYDNVKGFKHDFDDIVNMLGGYVKTNDFAGLKKYYVELEHDYEKVKNIATLNPNLINNPGIYNLLASKYKKATPLNIKIHLEYFFDFEKLHMPIYQFSRMLGILLDNAIEAASTAKDKEVNIYFRDSQHNNTQIVIIENTYSNTDVDIKKIFEKGVTGKEEHMGIGLWEVNQIIKQNNNIHLNTTNDNKYFKQQLEIYY